MAKNNNKPHPARQHQQQQEVAADESPPVGSLQPSHRLVYQYETCWLTEADFTAEANARGRQGWRLCQMVTSRRYVEYEKGVHLDTEGWFCVWCREKEEAKVS